MHYEYRCLLCTLSCALNWKAALRHASEKHGVTREQVMDGKRIIGSSGYSVLVSSDGVDYIARRPLKRAG